MDLVSFVVTRCDITCKFSSTHENLERMLGTLLDSRQFRMMMDCTLIN